MERHDARLEVRLFPERKEALEAIAKKLGFPSASTWARKVLDDALEAHGWKPPKGKPKEKLSDRLARHRAEQLQALPAPKTRAVAAQVRKSSRPPPPKAKKAAHVAKAPPKPKHLHFPEFRG